jgi:hypothetical protein
MPRHAASLDQTSEQPMRSDLLSRPFHANSQVSGALRAGMKAQVSGARSCGRPRAPARLLLGDSSSQVDRPPGGPGPRSCIGTRLATAIGAPLFVSRGETLPYVRFGSAASGCRNRTNPAVGLHRRTALPSTTSASGRRRSSRFISPQLRASSAAGVGGVPAETPPFHGRAAPWIGRCQ